MRIEKMKFGSITINGKEYKEDVIVTNNSVSTKESSHTITKEYVEDILLMNPDVIIIGTGTSGKVKVPKEVRDMVESHNKKMIIGKTPEVINDFNKMKTKNNVVGVFHLTC